MEGRGERVHRRARSDPYLTDEERAPAPTVAGWIKTRRRTTRKMASCVLVDMRWLEQHTAHEHRHRDEASRRARWRLSSGHSNPAAQDRATDRVESAGRRHYCCLKSGRDTASCMRTATRDTGSCTRTVINSCRARSPGRGDTRHSMPRRRSALQGLPSFFKSVNNRGLSLSGERSVVGGSWLSLSRTALL